MLRKLPSIFDTFSADFANIVKVSDDYEDALYQADEIKSKKKVYLRYLKTSDKRVFQYCSKTLEYLKEKSIPGIVQILGFRTLQALNELYYVIPYSEQLDFRRLKKENMTKDQIIDIGVQLSCKFQRLHELNHEMRTINVNHLFIADNEFLIDPISRAIEDPVIQIGNMLKILVKTFNEHSKNHSFANISIISDEFTEIDEWQSLFIVAESMSNSFNVPFSVKKLEFYRQELLELQIQITEIAEEQCGISDTVRQFPHIGQIRKPPFSVDKKQYLQTMRLRLNSYRDPELKNDQDKIFGSTMPCRKIHLLQFLDEPEKSEVIKYRAEMVQALLNTGKLLKAYELAETTGDKIIQSGLAKASLANEIIYIASAYHKNGNYHMALNLREKYNEYTKTAQNPNQIDTALSLLCLSESYRAFYLKNEAKKAIQESYEMLKTQLQPNDPRLLECQVELIQVLLLNGKLDNNTSDILKSVQIAAKLRKELLQESPNNEHILAVLSANLSKAYKYLQQPEKSIEFAKAALDFRIKSLSEDDFRVGEAMNVYCSAIGPKSLDKYFKHLFQAKKIFKKATKLPTLELVKVYKLIGKGFLYINKGDKAIYFLLKAKDLVEKIFGYNHIEMAKICRMLGSLSLQLKDNQTALENYRISLKIYEMKFGETHIQSAMVKLNMGMAYNKLGFHQTALDLIDPVLKIFTEKYNADHQKVVKVFSLMGETHLNLNSIKEAAKYFEKAYHIQRQETPTNDPKLARIMCNLGMIAFQENDIGKAFDHLFRARNIYLKTGYGTDRKAHLVDEKIKELRNKLKSPQSVITYYYYQLKYLLDEKHFV